MDKSLLFIMIAFAIFGSMMIYSASSITAIQKYGVTPGYFFYKQLVFVGIGLVGFFVMSVIPYPVYLKLSFFAYLATIGLLMFVFTQDPLNNAYSWISIAGFTIQPAEFAKIGLILYLAATFNNFKGEVESWWQWLWPLVLGFISIMLVAGQPDMGTAMTMMVIYLIMLLAGEIPIFHLLKLFATALVALSILLFVDTVSTKVDILNAQQLKRFDYQNPCDDYINDGYQVCNGFIAINNGGLTGLGLGNSKQKHLYLPEAHNDFIMPIIIEELGFLLSLLIISGYAFMVFKGISIAVKTNDLFGTLVALGVTAFLLAHILINLGGVFGIIPMTGVPLPFLSAGGSNVIAILTSFGMLQSVAIRNNQLLEE
jgi:cell division protein FtsW